jgi:hypothetical protein
MLGLHFDPDLPLIATSAFHAGEIKVEAGDAFDWRARGLTELEAVALFSAGLLTAATSAAPIATSQAAVKQKLEQSRRGSR